MRRAGTHRPAETIEQGRVRPRRCLLRAAFALRRGGQGRPRSSRCASSPPPRSTLVCASRGRPTGRVPRARERLPAARPRGRAAAGGGRQPAGAAVQLELDPAVRGRAERAGQPGVRVRPWRSAQPAGSRLCGAAAARASRSRRPRARRRFERRGCRPAGPGASAFRRPWRPPELERLALWPSGADVPFFLSPGPARVSGIGERAGAAGRQPAAALAACWRIPAVPLATAAVFGRTRHLPRRRAGPLGPDLDGRAGSAGAASSCGRLARNDLEPAATQLYARRLAPLRRALEAGGRRGGRALRQRRYPLRRLRAGQDAAEARERRLSRGGSELGPGYGSRGRANPDRMPDR